MQDRAQSTTKDWLTQVGALLVARVRHLAEAIAHRGRRSKVRRLQLVESLELGNRRQLFLIVCDDHPFLVGAGSDRVGTLVAVPLHGMEPDAFPSGLKAAYPARLPAFAWRRNHPWHPVPAGGSHGLQLVRATTETQAAQGQSVMDKGKRLWP